MSGHAATLSAGPEGTVIVLYDGVCGLCDRTVRFLLKRDRDDRLRFASLQSDFARDVLARHHRDPRDLDTVYLVIDHGEASERLLARADAILHALKLVGGVWRLSALARLLPRSLRNRAYDVVAGNRYRWFGRCDVCPVPAPEHRKKFLAIE